MTTIAGKQCTLYTAESPECLLIQPADEHDLASLDRQVSLMASSSAVPFTLCAFQVGNWNTDLSPWDAPPVFGNEPFGRGAPDTLEWVEKSLLPALREQQNIDIPVILGGYSLAGFFALWSVYMTGTFRAAACASPSVWFPGWMEYAETHPAKAGAVYLSLGNREEKTRNPVMARVGVCIRRQHELLKDTSVLEWNEGNHFREPDVRTARAFVWCMEQVRKNRA